ncbi:MAG: aconitase X catalytic domain-containing protein [Planctomycetota bacterium]|jgi:predicted aconitase|nr:aconitase X catalytic domain-containing protein [Planctomycetota bacterium]
MLLTEEQKGIMNGKSGEFPAKCMKLLVDWGIAMGAERLVPVEQTMPAYLTAPGHTLKSSAAAINNYINYVGEFLEYETKCPAACHIARFDLDKPEVMRISPESVAAQKKLKNLGRNAGISMTWSCAPYLCGHIPMPGQICAWTESHAVVLVNSFWGARTTRNSGETALAAGITGWIPEFGALADAGRKKADLVIDVKAIPGNDLEWGLLGYWAGKHAAINTPAFVGLEKTRPRLEAARQMCAGLAASGGSTMLHIVGVTREAPTLDALKFPQDKPEAHEYGEREKESLLSRYGADSGSKVDVVYFGCPHASMQELIEIAKLVKGKKAHPGTTLLITSNHPILSLAKRTGFAQIIEDFGGLLLSDTCPLQAPGLDSFKAWKCMATSDIKQAHYIRAILGTHSVVGSTEKCVNAAITGRWEG